MAGGSPTRSSWKADAFTWYIPLPECRDRWYIDFEPFCIETSIDELHRLEARPEERVDTLEPERPADTGVGEVEARLRVPRPGTVRTGSPPLGRVLSAMSRGR